MAVWFDISDAAFTTCCLSGILAHQQHQYVFSCRHLLSSVYLGARIFYPPSLGTSAVSPSNSQAGTCNCLKIMSNQVSYFLQAMT